MSQTKTAFAERAIRSLKNIPYRYMEDNGYKYIDKSTKFVTTLVSSRNCSIVLIPKNVKSSDFLSSLYSKPLQEFRKTNFKIGDRVRISKYDLPFRKGCNHNLHKRFSKLLQFLPENLQHTQKKE